MLRISTAASFSAPRSSTRCLITSGEAQRALSAPSVSNATDRAKETLHRHRGSAGRMYWSSDDEQASVECLSLEDPNVHFGEDWTADNGRKLPSAAVESRDQVRGAR
jgi:hypothetical protein